MRKKNKKRSSAVEILSTLTRENILSYIEERDSLATNIQKVEATISAMRSANLSEEHIETVRKTVAAGAMERLSYLENITKRVALIIVRAKGYNNLRNIVMENLDMIPTAEEKKANATNGTKDILSSQFVETE